MKMSEARDFWRARGVPEEAIDDLWHLAEAARTNDARGEEHSEGHGEGLVRLLTEAGWHPEAITYIANQRAMLVEQLLTVPGAEEALREMAAKMEPHVVVGSNEIMRTVLAMAWIDGFATSFTATKLKGQA